MNYLAFDKYEDSAEETFKKIPKNPKNFDKDNQKGKKRNKRDYSKERERKRGSYE